MKLLTQIILSCIFIFSLACSGQEISPKGIIFQLNGQPIALPYIEVFEDDSLNTIIKASSPEARIRITLNSFEEDSLSQQASSLYFEDFNTAFKATFDSQAINIEELKVINDDIKVLTGKFSAVHQQVLDEKDSFKYRISEGVINY